MFLNNILNLQRELDVMFGNDLYDHATCARGLYPAINIFEKESGLVVKAELPSVKKEDISIELEGDSLTLAGERKNEFEDDIVFHRREREAGAFRRKIKLPYRVDSERVLAKLDNGVLTIELEKDQRDLARKIDVQ